MQRTDRYAAMLGLAMACASLCAPAQANETRSSRISDERVVKIDPDAMPKRPAPLLELGPRFLGTGPISPGFESFTGEIWQPQLVVFGTYRSALQAYNNGLDTRSEWANSLNLFANLALSYTNRILLGINPLVQDGRFTGYEFKNPDDARRDDHGIRAYNGNLTTAFFEGDLGELFPSLDEGDSKALDFGFSIGRQPLSYQDGMLINDSIDAIGVTRNNILPKGGSNLQVTVLYGWNEVTTNDNRESKRSSLYGLFTQADYPWSTLNFDFAFVRRIDNAANGVFWGLSATQRIRKLNTTFRLLGSHATDKLPANGAGVSPLDDGYLLFTQMNYTPAWTHNNLYLDAFWGIDHYTSAARGPAVGGPLGNTGILFASFGIGNFNSFGAALGNRPDKSAGAALGYQIFSEDTRRQYIVEVGGRDRTDDAPNGRQLGVGLRFQQALGRRFIIRVDGFGDKRQGISDMGWGSRLEFLTQF